MRAILDRCGFAAGFNPDVLGLKLMCGGRESVRLTFVLGVRWF